MMFIRALIFISAAVRLESAVLSMQGNTTIHEAHPVKLTMFRDLYKNLDWQAY